MNFEEETVFRKK